MFRRKRREYGPHLHDFEVGQGVGYRPMVWSVFGRAHPEAQVMLASMAAVATQCRRLCDHRLILRRVRCAIGVACWCWTSAMLHVRLG